MPVRSSVVSLIFVARSSKSSGFRQAKSLLLCSHRKNRISSATWFSQVFLAIGLDGLPWRGWVGGRLRQ